ncbi:Homeodomain-interacting protein kinase 1 [Neolecta irregularis DAH-3]|uniref:Homeodomain-interacting protein kinase 1 n=1 Tax=Neolecta irregularis (strain DAH-3) TaxID=1198029 RepID=A0A1U7LMZ4_NEOID|nr:Homeodomain-interacting protein kinase 1 [Neolecta irregularis DAH-3]|eukprot:OLL24009.1 Homeodomain-interacting protein kinase 1 [Neolecta irregularis DAH-3]
MNPSEIYPEDSLKCTTRLTLGLFPLYESIRENQIDQTHHNEAPALPLSNSSRKRKRKARSISTGSHTTKRPKIPVESNRSSLPTPPIDTIAIPLIASRYRRIAEAGQGAFSVTILAQDTFLPERPIVAIKKMKDGFNAIGQREYNALRQLHNLHIPRYAIIPIVRPISSFHENGSFHLVLERLDPTPLVLPRCPHKVFDENGKCRARHSNVACPVRHKALRLIATQILDAVAFLHDFTGNMHADIKPENVMFTERDELEPYQLRLIDLSNVIPIHEREIYFDDFELQSAQYRAPEVMVGLPFNEKIDIFSIGLILLELLISDELNHSTLVGSHCASRSAFVETICSLIGPFPEFYQEGKFWRVEYAHLKSTYSLKSCLDDSQDISLNEFIHQLLKLDPSRRFSAMEALEHDWIVGGSGYRSIVGIKSWSERHSKTNIATEHFGSESPLLDKTVPCKPQHVQQSSCNDSSLSCAVEEIQIPFGRTRNTNGTDKVDEQNENDRQDLGCSTPISCQHSPLEPLLAEGDNDEVIFV